MLPDQIIIRQSRLEQWGYVIATSLMILWYFIGPYDMTRSIYEKSPGFTILLGFIFFGLLFYFTSELINWYAEITLNKEGIELRDIGFFEWDRIQSFSTLSYPYRDSRTIELVLHFSEFADLRFEITSLEKNKEELVDLIQQYKGPASLFFAGHNTKR